MQKLGLLTYAGMIGIAFSPALAFALPNIHPALVQPTVSSTLSGSWQTVQANFLPPGITAFEAIHSTLTFGPDGIFYVVVEKPTGSFRGQGSYIVQGSTLALSFSNGSLAYYHLSRTGDCLTLRLLAKAQSEPVLLLLVKPASSAQDTKQPTASPSK